jgi:hypothetical protein
MKKLILSLFAIFFAVTLFGQYVSRTLYVATTSAKFQRDVNVNDLILCGSDNTVYRMTVAARADGMLSTYMIAATAVPVSKLITPIRPATGEYWYAHDVSGGYPFTSLTPAKTYMYYTSVSRTSGKVMTGDSRDVLFKGTYSNYAVNDASSQFQGIGVSGRNRSGGVFATMNAGEFGINNSSGGTLTNAYGGTFTVENYGTLSTLIAGVKIDLRNEGAKATSEYGLYVTNTNNSLGTAADAAVKIADAGANIGWTSGLDLNGATVIQDIKLNTAVVIASGSAANDGAIKSAMGYTAPAGSIYISTAGAGTVWVMQTTTWTQLTIN